MSGSRLPSVSARKVIQVLRRAGFQVDRIVGSHHVPVYPGDPARTVVVPYHSRHDLKPGTLRSIVPQAGLSVQEFNEFL